MGDQVSELHLSEDGKELSGAMTKGADTAKIENGKVDGDTLSWQMPIERPMPMRLHFSGTRTKEIITGKVKFGMFAKGTFEAIRHR